jgi:hypothetical protein
MKSLKIIHTALGIIPFLWFISFLFILMIGTIKLGYIPEYGDQIDPYALNLHSLSFIHFWLFILSFFAFFLWLTGTVVIMIFFRKKDSLNNLSTALFITGTAGFFIFKYGLTDYFAWVFD